MDLKKVADVVLLAYQKFMTIAKPADEATYDEDLRTADGYADMKAADMLETKEW